MGHRYLVAPCSMLHVLCIFRTFYSLKSIVNTLLQIIYL
jgi:hypothetical protein